MPGMIDYQVVAQRDYNTALILEQYFPDEFAVANAAYHIQQAVEKMLKALILAHGEQPEFSHRIGQLIEHLEKFGWHPPECLDYVADTLTLWEATVRYDPYISFSERKYSLAKESYSILVDQYSVFVKRIKETEQNEETPVVEQDETKNELGFGY